MAEVIYAFDSAGKNWPFSNPNHPAILRTLWPRFYDITHIVYN